MRVSFRSIIGICCCMLLLYSNTTVVAQEDLSVLNGKLYSDAQNILYHHITGEAYRYLETRDKALAGIKTQEQYRGYLESVKSKLKAAFGPLPEADIFHACALPLKEVEVGEVEAYLLPRMGRECGIRDLEGQALARLGDAAGVAGSCAKVRSAAGRYWGAIVMRMDRGRPHLAIVYNPPQDRRTSWGRLWKRHQLGASSSTSRIRMIRGGKTDVIY